MSRYLAPVLALCILSLLAVVLLSPSPTEKLELSLSTMSAPRSLAALNRYYDQGGRDPNLLLKRADLALEAADPAAAIEQRVQEEIRAIRRDVSSEEDMHAHDP